MVVANLCKTGLKSVPRWLPRSNTCGQAILGSRVEKGHQPTAQELAALGGDIIKIRYEDT